MALIGELYCPQTALVSLVCCNFYLLFPYRLSIAVVEDEFSDAGRSESDDDYDPSFEVYIG